MFIDLLDVLRCVRPHEDTWLVGAFDRWDGRRVVAGRLGCPVCGAEYPIVDGVVYFAVERAATPAAPPAADVARGPSSGDESEAALRLAAMLDLRDPGGVIVLAGSWARLAAALRGVADQVEQLLLDSPPGTVDQDGHSALVTAGAVPLAAGSCRGVALDERTSAPDYVNGAARALRPRGRLVAPASLPVPPDVRELARDAAVWVGERGAAPPPLVALGVGRRGRE